MKKMSVKIENEDGSYIIRTDWGSNIWNEKIYNDKDQLIYQKCNDNSWTLYEYDCYGFVCYESNNSGYWEKRINNHLGKILHLRTRKMWEMWEYDALGREIYFENQYGRWEINEYIGENEKPTFTDGSEFSKPKGKRQNDYNKTKNKVHSNQDTKYPVSVDDVYESIIFVGTTESPWLNRAIQKTFTVVKVDYTDKFGVYVKVKTKYLDNGVEVEHKKIERYSFMFITSIGKIKSGI